MGLADLWQRVVEKIGTRIDRVTHTRYRRSAALRAERGGRPPHVMMVCYGNICRSPFAEVYLRDSLERDGIRDVVIESSGFIGPDRPANDQGAAIARTRGIDVSNHKSKLFHRRDAERAGLVLVMTRHQRDRLIAQFGVPAERIELLGDFDIDDPPYREIGDPYGKSDDEFRRVFGQIERSLDGLRASWSRAGRSPASVPPPNGGGSR